MAAVEERDIEVEREDQMRINQFSRLNLRYDELDEDIKDLKKKVTTYKDATEEIEGCMEADGIMIKVGEVYTGADEDTIIEKLSKLSEQAEEQLRKNTDEIEEVKAQMDELKKILYGKFGTSINLEK
eukprot:TRINITY_DN52100_c0_g1_i1.p2 TRINITY_DN52100_c0_g1~~TRINITY_DN52100_c0_g1_i1.p2  ORF type:complete len:148 (-),score=45.24 TRINITY_DN52100_c0_g1_i1:123-503(-)